MGFTTYLKNEILDHLFGAAIYSPPSSLYIGLSTTTPGVDGSNITEPAAGGYSRVALASNLTNFPAADGGQKANGVIISFPQASADWGTITHFFVADAPSGGNVLATGQLNAARAIATGAVPAFAVGAFVITLPAA